MGDLLLYLLNRAPTTQGIIHADIRMVGIFFRIILKRHWMKGCSILAWCFYLCFFSPGFRTALIWFRRIACLPFLSNPKTHKFKNSAQTPQKLPFRKPTGITCYPKPSPPLLTPLPPPSEPPNSHQTHLSHPNPKKLTSSNPSQPWLRKPWKFRKTTFNIFLTKSLKNQKFTLAINLSSNPTHSEQLHWDAQNDLYTSNLFEGSGPYLQNYVM